MRDKKPSEVPRKQSECSIVEWRHQSIGSLDRHCGLGHHAG